MKLKFNFYVLDLPHVARLTGIHLGQNKRDLGLHSVRNGLCVVSASEKAHLREPPDDIEASNRFNP